MCTTLPFSIWFWKIISPLTCHSPRKTIFSMARISSSMTISRVFVVCMRFILRRAGHRFICKTPYLAMRCLISCNFVVLRVPDSVQNINLLIKQLIWKCKQIKMRNKEIQPQHINCRPTISSDHSLTQNIIIEKNKTYFCAEQTKLRCRLFFTFPHVLLIKGKHCNRVEKNLNYVF